jgi:hypothetical protein
LLERVAERQTACVGDREPAAITRATFGAESDFTHIAKLLEDWAGVAFRG